MIFPRDAGLVVGDRRQLSGRSSDHPFTHTRYPPGSLKKRWWEPCVTYGSPPHPHHSSPSICPRHNWSSCSRQNKAARSLARPIKSTRPQRGLCDIASAHIPVARSASASSAKHPRSTAQDTRYRLPLATAANARNICCGTANRCGLVCVLGGETEWSRACRPVVVRRPVEGKVG